MPVDLRALLDDLADEEAELARVLEALEEPAWDLPTPAAGWTVRHQVAHLAEGEELAASALRDEAAFAQHLAALLADLDETLEAMEARARAATAAATLGRWEAARQTTLASLRRRRPGDRVMWVTGPMTCASFATARLMETWAHGQDVLDALGRSRPATHRLRHIAHLGVATREFSFANRGLDAPPAPTVALGGPDGSTWRWPGAASGGSVVGAALDLCLVVTQRRHVDDTDLVVEGEGARQWMAIAQAFAGPPTTGPPPRRRRQ